MLLNRQTLRSVVFHADGYWYAQMLEYDILARSQHLNSVIGNLIDCFKFQLKTPSGLDRIKPAPDYYQQLWSENNSFFNRNVKDSKHIFQFMIVGVADYCSCKAKETENDTQTD